MNAPLSKDVFVSILAMDSYARGGGDDAWFGGKYRLPAEGMIGTAALLANSEQRLPTLGGTDVGFFATAYQWEGTTVISYRGTNMGPSGLPSLDDVWHGWTLGAGFDEASQAGYAVKFYEDVTGLSVFDPLTPIGGSPVLLTGHSLGGGLAGYIASHSYRQAIGFDHMPFGLAAWATAVSESVIRAADEMGLSLDDIASVLRDATSLNTMLGTALTIGQFLDKVGLYLDEVEPYPGALRGYFVSGEVLEMVRDGKVQLAIGAGGGTLLSILGAPIFGAGLAAYGSYLGAGTKDLEDQSAKTELSVYGANFTATEKHSQALLTTLLFGEKQWGSEGGGSAWQDSARYFLPSIMSEQIAKTGFSITDAGTSAGAQMAAMIAYSAINEGTRVFGDTAIRALFNDADDLGKAVHHSGSFGEPGILTENVNFALGDLIAEYAGLLATKKVLSADNAEALDGILTFGEGAGNYALAIDLRDSRWSIGGSEHEIIGKRPLIDKFFFDFGAPSLLAELSSWYAAKANAPGTGDLLGDIDEIIVSLTPNGMFAPKDTDGVAFQIGSSERDKFQFTGGSDFVYGAGGGDELYGLGGADILLGGGGADTLYGGGDNDWLGGGTGNDILFGNDGDDYLLGGAGVDALDGGAGNDTLVGAGDGIGDTLTGGAGSDIFQAGHGDVITDLSREDLRVYIEDKFNAPQSLQSFAPAASPVEEFNAPSLRLAAGGESQLPPRNPCNWWETTPPGDGKSYIAADGTRYTLSGGRLNIDYGGGTVYVEGFRNGDAGIRLKDARPDVDQAECQRDPLIIDLDGNRNVVRELFDSTAYFDLDNDGFRERVAWSLANDGFLVRDLNGNGLIDNGTEMFGSGRAEQDGGSVQLRGTAGFAELATLDSNRDGLISADDTGFASLRVWVDANGDAVTDAGELKTLAELGLVSISLKTRASDDLDCGCDGTEITHASSAWFADGSARTVYDAYLSIDQYDTREVVTDVTVPAELAELPFLLGTGNVSDLDVAMARDPVLEEMVRAFAALDMSQVGEIGARVEQIILRWTGADEVPYDNRGSAINARWLAAIEKISGSEFNQAAVGRNPRADAASVIIEDWNEIVGNVTARLLGQTALGQSLLPGLSLAGAAFYTVKEGTTIAGALAKAELAAPADEGDKLSYWRTIAVTLQRYAGAFGVTQEQMLGVVDQVLQRQGLGLSASELVDALFASSAAGGLVVDSAISSVNGKTYATDRVLIAAGGDARVNGGSGNDRYIVTRAAGEVSIIDIGGADTLELRGWRQGETDVTTRVLRSNSDPRAGTLATLFEVTLSQGDSSVTLEVEFSAGKFRTTTEKVVFDDITYDVVDLLGSRDNIVIGGAGTTHDFGGDPNNQFLMGRSAGDTYHLSSSGGQDTILDSAAALSPNDVLRIDALQNQVHFAAAGGDYANLLVSLLNSDSKVTALGQFGGSGQEIETFEFKDGSRLTAAQVRTLLTTGTSAAETLRGTADDDLFDGKGGSDVVSGGKGRDIYVFRPGYGRLVVDDVNGESVIRIEGSVSEADLDFTVTTEGLRVTLGSGGDSILLRGNALGTGARFELNGAVVDLGKQLAQKARQAGTLASGQIFGTPLNEWLEGSEEGDLLSGGGGDDYLDGGLGNDSYLVVSGRIDIRDAGFGYDRILIDSAYSLADFEFVSANRIRLGRMALRVDFSNGVNPTTGLAQPREGDIEAIVFADGYYTIDLTAGRVLSGGTSDDVLFNFGTEATTFTPGAGNDYIYSVNGNHALRLEQGFGHDVFHSRTAGNITFSGIALDNTVSFARDNLDLVIKVANGADTLTLKNVFEPLASFRNRTLFFSGSQITLQEVANSLTVATSGDDLLWGRTTLDGGAGNDILIGTRDKNEYSFGRGYGHDTIKEQDSIFGNYNYEGRYTDRLTLVGLNPYDVTFARHPSDPLSVILTIRDTGETLTLDGTPFDDFISHSEDIPGGGYSIGDQNGAHWIDEIVFADGTILSQRDIEQSIILGERTDGADVLINFGSTEDMDGAVLDGGLGDDTYTNQFDNVTVGMSAGSGSDRLVNLNADKTAGHTGTTVQVRLNGISAADVSVFYEYQNGEIVTVLRARSGEELVINGHQYRYNSPLWVYDEEEREYYYPRFEGALVEGQIATDGDDLLNGARAGTDDPFVNQSVNDIFNPGRGNDIIFGRGGIDTIYFNLGDGADVLAPSANQPRPDDRYEIILGQDINREDVRLARWQNDTNSLSVRLTFNEFGDSITLDSRSKGTIQYHDGSTSSLEDLLNNPPSELDEIIHVEQPYNIIDGLAGNDEIWLSGFYTHVHWGRGSDNDTIFSNNYSDLNINWITFKDIFSSDELEVFGGIQSKGDLIIRIRDTGEELRIASQWRADYDGNQSSVIHEFIFANGERLSHGQMLALVAGESKAGDNTFTTGPHGGLLDGGAGNDVLAGGSGDDVYIFGRGFDEDRVRDAGGNDTLTFAEGVAISDLHFSRTGQAGGDLLIEVTGRERLSLTIAGQFASGSARIENFQFADGRTFAWGEIEAMILEQAQTSGDDSIVGFASDDILRGLAGDDTLTGHGGNDVIDGGAGQDTAAYRGASADYDIVMENGSIIVTDRATSRDGTDRLSGIEHLHFLGDGVILNIVDLFPQKNVAPVVLKPLPDVAASRGTTFDMALPAGTFGDSNGDKLTYSATMADGSALPAWLTFSNGRLTGTVAPGALGAYDIRITANDGSLTASDVFTLNVGVKTGPELTPAQSALFGNGNDRIVGRGAQNVTINGLGGDDYITVDAYNVKLLGGEGNDVFEFLGEYTTATGGAGIDTFIFDGFSLLSGYPSETWATVTDFENGVDRIGIVNGTGGVNSFADLTPFMVQKWDGVEIVIKGLPKIKLANANLADLDASDFMFGNWLTDGGFGPAPAPGSVPWPVTSEVRTIKDRANIGNASERILGSGAGNTWVEAFDGDDYITSDGTHVHIYGGRGNDVIELFGARNYAMGGAGYDYFVFDSTQLKAAPGEVTWATITDFHKGVDKIVFLNGMAGINSFEDLQPFLSQPGHAKISITGLPAIIIEDITLAELDASDFLFVDQLGDATSQAFQGASSLMNSEDPGSEVSARKHLESRRKVESYAALERWLGNPNTPKGATIMRQSIKRVAEDQSASAQAHRVAKIDRTLAAIIQDMGAFGAKSAFESHRVAHDESARLVEFFA